MSFPYTWPRSLFWLRTALNIAHFVTTRPSGQFIKRPASQKAIFAGLTPPASLDPDDLLPYPTHGHFFVSSPWRCHQETPLFLVMCFDRVFDDRVNQQMLKIWDRMNDKGLTSSEKRLNRSDSKQCHFGIWEHYSSFPRVTVDSRTQNMCVETALDEFLTLLGKMVIPRMNNLLYRYDRPNWERQKT